MKKDNDTNYEIEKFKSIKKSIEENILRKEQNRKRSHEIIEKCVDIMKKYNT